ncbi:MAG TPA: hypothetical protein VKX39_03655 [Bryobacteraceae bacterium]|jgi:hypothetical protein|nr:hypothetical protein [Bryobacteraceae bacterium]
MRLSPFYRRSLAFFAVSLILGLIIRLWPDDTRQTVVAPTAETLAAAERRLAHAREVAATVPGKEEILKRAQAELALREKGLLAADTAPQAQAQLVQILRAVGGAESPAVDIRSESFGVSALSGDYGVASAGVLFECRIDQLVNMLAAITARPELLSIADLHINSTANKDKRITVRLTLSAVVPRKLVPGRRA